MNVSFSYMISNALGLTRSLTPCRPERLPWMLPSNFRLNVSQFIYVSLLIHRRSSLQFTSKTCDYNGSGSVRFPHSVLSLGEIKDWWYPHRYQWPLQYNEFRSIWESRYQVSIQSAVIMQAQSGRWIIMQRRIRDQRQTWSRRLTRSQNPAQSLEATRTASPIRKFKAPANKNAKGNTNAKSKPKSK